MKRYRVVYNGRDKDGNTVFGVKTFRTYFGYIRFVNKFKKKRINKWYNDPLKRGGGYGDKL